MHLHTRVHTHMYVYVCMYVHTAGGVAQLIEGLPGAHEVLVSIPSPGQNQVFEHMSVSPDIWKVEAGGSEM